MPEYAGNSLIHSRGQVSAQSIQAWFVAKGPAAAKYVGLPYKPAPSEIGAAMVQICQDAEAASGRPLNHDLLAAQIAKESAYWQSRIVRDKNNPGGYGAENDDPYNKAVAFASAYAGIKTTAAHLLTYTMGDANPWRSTDTRAGDVKSAHPDAYGRCVTLHDLNGRWAVPGPTYGEGIANLANELVAFDNAQPATPGGTMPRIIVAAGHENIRNITADRIGQTSANNLRGSTGALGREAEWTAPWRDALVTRLRALGIDAIGTDSIYHASVYGTKADLVLCGHCDGVSHPAGQPARPQWCMAAAVLSGNSLDSADAIAQSFVDKWYAMYPKAANYASNGPVTDDMRWYYGGWYRTTDSPMVLIEHGILGDNGQWRNDLVTPEEAAHYDADVVAAWLGMAAYQDTPDVREFSETGKHIGHGFLRYWEENNGIVNDGLPLTEEIQEGGITVQYLERSRYEYQPGIANNKWGVVKGRVAAELLEARAEIDRLKAELAKQGS